MSPDCSPATGRLSGDALPAGRSWPWAALLHRCRRDGGREDGVSTVEMVLLLPLVVFLTLLPVQAGLVWHARQVMVAAAQEGARAAREADLSVTDAQAVGEQRAQQFAAGVGGNAVRGTTVRVDRSQVAVRVDVAGTALAIVPAFSVRVRGHAVSPVERFVAP